MCTQDIAEQGELGIPTYPVWTSAVSCKKLWMKPEFLNNSKRKSEFKSK